MTTTRSDLLLVIACAIVAIATTLWGDEPRWTDPFPRMPTSSATLQAMIDEPGPTDLGWGVYELDHIILSMAHDGEVIKNGYLRANVIPASKIGNISICRNINWFGVSYPDGLLDLEFDNVHIDGGFPVDTGLQQHNEFLADQAGRNVNMITTITRGIESMNIHDCSFSNCPNSGWAGMAKKFTGERNRFYRVAKHCYGIRGYSGNTTVLRDNFAIDCGNAFDFHSDDQVRRDPHVALVENYEIVTPRGRTKLNDSNLDLTAVNINFRQDNVINLNHYPGLDVVMRPRALRITGITVQNFWAHGIRFGDDKTDPTGFNDIADGSITNSLNAMTLLQPVNVEMMVYSKCNFEYRSQGPVSQESNITAQVGTDLYWARVLDGCELKMAAFNREHGQSYVLSYWVPSDVLAKMETR